MMQAAEKAAFEATGRREKYQQKTALRIWNDEVTERTEKSCIYLQNKTERYYHQKRNAARSVIRKRQQTFWERFISVYFISMIY